MSSLTMINAQERPEQLPYTVGFSEEEYGTHTIHTNFTTKTVTIEKKPEGASCYSVAVTCLAEWHADYSFGAMEGPNMESSYSVQVNNQPVYSGSKSLVLQTAERITFTARDDVLSAYVVRQFSAPETYQIDLSKTRLTAIKV